MKQEIKWRIWHTFKDGTTFKPGEELPHTPESAECFRQAMLIVDRALSNRMKEVANV